MIKLPITTLGPQLPFKFCGSTMITFPNGKGVVIIGGKIYEFVQRLLQPHEHADAHSAENITFSRDADCFVESNHKYEDSDALFELSGDSEEFLEWSKLEQKLQYPRHGHVSFYVPNEVANDFKKSQKIKNRDKRKWRRQKNEMWKKWLQKVSIQEINIGKLWCWYKTFEFITFGGNFITLGIIRCTYKQKQKIIFQKKDLCDNNFNNAEAKKEFIII